MQSFSSQVQAQLERISRSPQFRRAERSKRFLRYVTECALRGEKERLKEYPIGIEVFDRPEEFDPRLDAVVRVEAPRLRAKLADYYATEGRRDPVKIEIPKGSYVPVFRNRTPRRKSVSQPSMESTVSLTKAILKPPNPLLVGRDRQLQELNDHFTSSANGNGRMLCVIAEPGIGKTALIEAFLNRHKESAQIGTARCRKQLQAGQPYQAWLDILSSIAASNTVFRHALEQKGPSWWHQLVPSKSSNGNSATLMRLRREMLLLLAELTHSSPLILFFDDLHWADIATIDLLNQLLSELATMPVFILAAYRASDMEIAGNAFLAVRSELKMRGFCFDLLLPELSPESIRAYLDRRFPGHEFPKRVIVGLYEVSGGNALCLTDMVEHALRRNWIQANGDRWQFAAPVSIWRTDLPDSVIAMATKKLEELNESDRHLLWVASLQGVAFDSALAGRALGIEENQIESSLDRLRHRHQVLRLAPAEFIPSHGSRYEFSHVLYFDALQHVPLPGQRAEFSKRTAEAMIEVYRDNTEPIAVVVAGLLRTAGDIAQALSFYLQAASRAFRLSAFRQVLEITKTALELTEQMARTPKLVGQELEFVTIQGWATSSLHGYEYAPLEPVYRRAQLLADELGDQSASMRTDMAFWSFVAVTDCEKGIRVAKRLVKRAKSSNRAEHLINSYIASGVSLIHTGRIPQAVEALTKAGGYCTPDTGKNFLPSAAIDPRVAVFCNRARALWFAGFPDRALSAVLEAWKLACELEHSKTKTYAAALLADIYHLRRDIENTLHYAEEAIKIGAQLEFSYEVTWAAFFRASALGERGNPEEGCRIGEETLTRYQGPCQPKLWSHCARWHAAIGNPVKGLRMLDSAYESAQKRGETYYDAELLRVRGELLLTGGIRAATAEALQCFQSALQVARRQKSLSLELRVVCSLLSFAAKHDGKTVPKRAADLVRLIGRFGEGLDTPDMIQANELLRGVGYPPQARKQMRKETNSQNVA